MDFEVQTRRAKGHLLQEVTERGNALKLGISAISLKMPNLALTDEPQHPLWATAN